MATGLKALKILPEGLFWSAPLTLEADFKK